MKEFCIFILSHNRADKIDSLNLIQKSDYCGDYYVVISTDNHEISKYKTKVGDSHLLIFDKENIQFDTMISRKNKILNSATYARNFVVLFAKKKYKYFAMVDDDVNHIKYRVNIKNKMIAIDCTSHLNEIFKYICDILEKSKSILGIGLKNNGGCFGGCAALDRYDREIQQFMFFKSEDIRMFKGLFWEDAIISCNNFDKIYISCPWICAKSPKQGTNKGGVSYNTNYYPPSLFWYISNPSG